MRSRTLLFAIAYVACLLAFLEIAARSYLGLDSVFYRLAGNDDSSWRLRWVRQHRHDAPIHYRFDVYDPTRGWALKPDLTDAVVFGDETLNTSSRGIRGKKEYAYEKPEGVTRILVLGDSFTFGEEVSDDETYPHHLERTLPDAEVLNFGVHGYGHDQMLIYLETEGVKYEPDVVLLGFIHRDMDRNLVGFRDFAKPRFAWRDGHLELLNSPVPSPEAVIERELYRLKLLDVFAIAYNNHRWKSGANAERMKAITFAILDRIAETAEEIGATPIFAYLPAWSEIVETREEPTEKESDLLDYCDERARTCFSVRPAFAEEVKRGAPFKTHGHWSEREHRIAAEAIGAFLVENVLAGRR